MSILEKYGFQTSVADENCSYLQMIKEQDCLQLTNVVITQ